MKTVFRIVLVSVVLAAMCIPADAEHIRIGRRKRHNMEAEKSRRALGGVAAAPALAAPKVPEDTAGMTAESVAEGINNTAAGIMEARKTVEGQAVKANGELQAAGSGPPSISAGALL